MFSGHQTCKKLFLFICAFLCTVCYCHAQSIDTLAAFDTLQARHIIHQTYSAEDSVIAQEVNAGTTTDSVLQKKHNPKLAVGLSIILPGAGQMYNKKWWKVPIIYACLGTSSYFVYRFASKMQIYKTEYRCRMQEGYGTPSPNLTMYSDDNILSSKKKYQRNMEISIAATAILYVLNIIDAAVDANLFYFDISDDLSMQIAPKIQQRTYTEYENYGVSLALKWK